MGSLVMSQTAQGLSEHRNNAYGQGRMMGDNDSRPGNQQHGASRSTSQRNAMPQSSPSSARTSNTQQPPAEPSLPPHETPSDAHTLPSTAQPPESGSNHRHGFDQSGFPLTSDPRGLHSSPSSPRLGPTHRSTLSLGGSEASSPSRLKVRDLAHIQSFASQDYLNKSKLAGRILESGRQYEISSMPVSDIIEMVAGLLTKITTTNDRQHDHIHRPVPSNDGTLNSQGSCVLAFHGKNVPSITILSYLSRIHKYCPTTYEVFLSLLVYFDRMTDNFNKAFLKKARSQAARSESSDSYASSITLTDDNREEEESSYRSDMVVEEEEDEEKREEGDSANRELDQFFVVDSFNIHRLVIAGVTCASKFFSDVFYTNSRYAKVGGLPLAELNNLELQFLILNDFRLSVPVEELEAYGTMLVEFYAREIVAQQQAADAQHQQMQQAAQHGEEMYMTGARSRSTAQSMPSST